MIIAIIIAVISLIAVGGAWSAGSRHGELSATSTPLALATVSTPAPDLPTRNERWIQEQEHVLFPERSYEEYGHAGCRVCGPGPLGRNEVPSVYDHVMVAPKFLSSSDGYGGQWFQEPVTDISSAEAISSKVEGTLYHTIMLDIDKMPVRLVESSTPGNFHLYVDKLITWPEYKKFLKASADIGLIEREFYKAACRNKGTHLRPPWKEK